MRRLKTSDPAGARTQDPNIKSVVLYQLSYGILLLRNETITVLRVQIYGHFRIHQIQDAFFLTMRKYIVFITSVLRRI